MTTLLDHRLPPRSRRRSGVLQVLLGLDFVLLISTLVVAFVGVVMIYSATRDKLALAGIDPHYFLVRQAVYVVIGIVVMAVMAALDYRWLAPASGILYVGIVLALLAMFTPLGSTALGATRWFQLGPIQVQPSAFGALALVVFVAAFCDRRSEGMKARDVAKLLALSAVPVLLVVKQPDLGSGIVMGVVLAVMLVAAGVPMRQMLVLVLLGVIVVVGVLHFGLLKHYQLQRLTGFLHQGRSPTGSTYNVVESKAAIGSGGMFGAGLFKGAQTNLSYVPSQQTDFIFSAVGEQLGFVGAATVVGLLGLVTWRVLRAAQVARDPFGRLLATGAFTLLAFSVFENVAMTMGLMPVAGIPLPFLSYGGSATVVFFAAVGIALSVHLRQQR
ncbi:MAG: rod shape-determining protein RodA [Acidimicrobiales bacterium]|jgi:rod shape determining protein RodA|nr:rod shape-determining protein RodA [Actinomycetota bacterium]MDA8183938.1 rod shape-determining protein RodA [Actinomycetota bacterium]